MGDFNYIDFLATSSAVREQQSSMLDATIESTGRNCVIFLLDKKNSDLDEVYGVPKNKMVFLPYFTQRALYKTNIWNGSLNLNIYEENEDQIEFQFNFDRMVFNIRNLKDKINGTLKIQNKTRNPIIVNIEQNRFTLSIIDNVLIDEDLNSINTIEDFVRKVNRKDIVFSYEGNNDLARNLKNKNNMLIMMGQVKSIDIKDKTYDNATDVIELGTIIVTDRYKAYKIVNARPDNDSFGRWLIWNAKGDLIPLNQIDGLPNNYRKVIENHRYNLPKVNLE
jgi:hypothetical protein